MSISILFFNISFN